MNVGAFNGTIDDCLTGSHVHNGMPFSTKDKDQDNWSSGNCAVSFTSAWWHNGCIHSNLNGKNFGYAKNDITSMCWISDWWGNPRSGYISLKTIKMALRKQ